MEEEAGKASLGNMVMLGAAVRHGELLDKELLDKSLVEHTPASKAALAELNKKMVEIGYNFK